MLTKPMQSPGTALLAGLHASVWWRFPGRTGAATRIRLLSGGLNLVLAVALSGCAGYRLGPTMERQARGLSVQVNPFANQTLEPRLSESVTLSVRKQLQQDGTYRLETGHDGDIIVTGSILEYERSEVSFVPRDTLTPQDYRVRIIAHVTARDRASGRVLVDRTVSGRTTLRVGPDLTSSERQAIPLAAADLARHVTSLLVDGEW